MISNLTQLSNSFIITQILRPAQRSGLIPPVPTCPTQYRNYSRHFYVQLDDWNRSQVPTCSVLTSSLAVWIDPSLRQTRRLELSPPPLPVSACSALTCGSTIWIGRPPNTRLRRFNVHLDHLHRSLPVSACSALTSS